MKIKQITSRNRRDFYAIYICEHCDHERSGDGYDDDFFHNMVIPRKVCEKCEKNSADDYQPIATKYQAHEVV